ncbi:hypothetical protein [Virgibacillus sp. DJP39]|uniref:hypothetical protein n=1 Tax=Virgibacillus sp. DJP39 TaxID=3409790 RepID=UPI003BB530E9
MSKAVYCDKCLLEIKVRDDLVTATIFFEVVPYHEECYSKDLKGAKSLFLTNQPINGFSGNIIILVIIALAITWAIVAEGPMKLLSAAGLIPIISRIYSYVIYERHTEK